MTNYVENLRAIGASCGGSSRFHKPNVILIIRNSVLVSRIQSLKAYNPFKTVFQSEPAENFNSMNFVRICEDLYLFSPRKMHKPWEYTPTNTTNKRLLNYWKENKCLQFSLGAGSAKDSSKQDLVSSSHKATSHAQNCYIRKWKVNHNHQMQVSHKGLPT